jgi:hypothetical protein
VQFTSRSRRALGVVAVSTIGMTTAVLGVTGVAQAAVPTYEVSGSGPTLPVPAGICAIDWALVGGGAGLDSDGVFGYEAGVVSVVLPTTVGAVYTLNPGGAGGDASGLTPGTGGQSADSDPDTQGADGTADTEMAGGGGGAASTVLKGSTTILQAYGADADDANGLGGLGGGGGENIAVGAEWFDEGFDSSGDDGVIAGEGIPCAPASPYLNGVSEKDQALELNFVPGEDGDLPTHHYEYTLDEGATQATLTGTTVLEGRTYATISGLTNGTGYTVAIRAVAANGSATEWTQGESGTPHRKATAPANLQVETGEAALTISWGAATAGTYPITGYRVETVWSDGERGGGTEICATGPAELSCTAEVEPGKKHDVVVYALDNSTRQGEWAHVTSGLVPFSSSVPASDGDLTLPAGSTASVPAGKTITVSGSGYAPGSTVTVLIYSEPQVLTTVVADENGDFTVTVTVPAGLAPGQHTLVASGVDSQGNPRYVTLPVTVVAGLASTGADIAVPAIGGLAALTVGGALLFVSRRRSKVS